MTVDCVGTRCTRSKECTPDKKKTLAHQGLAKFKAIANKVCELTGLSKSVLAEGFVAQFIAPKSKSTGMALALTPQHRNHHRHTHFRPPPHPPPPTPTHTRTHTHTHAHMPPPYSPRHAAAFAKSPTPNIGRSRRDRDQARAARQRTAARADPTMQGAIPPNHLRFGTAPYHAWLRDQCAPLTRRPCAH